MKTLFNTLLMSLLVCSVAFAQKKEGMVVKKVEVNNITPSEWNDTFKSEGTSEVGRTTVTLSDDLSKIYVSYIDGNYQTYSCSKSLQKLTEYVYVTGDITCGGASGYNAEITLEETITSYKLDLVFRYCAGNELKNVVKHLSKSKPMKPMVGN